MSGYLAQDFRNLALVLAAMLALVIFVPGRVIPAETLSQRAVMLGVLGTALMALMAGGVVFFLLYARLNPGQGALLLQNPLDRVGFFLGRSALVAMLWGPVLGFVWLRAAQAVERRRGEMVVREGARIGGDGKW